MSLDFVLNHPPVRRVAILILTMRSLSSRQLFKAHWLSLSYTQAAVPTINIYRVLGAFPIAIAILMVVLATLEATFISQGPTCRWLEAPMAGAIRFIAMTDRKLAISLPHSPLMLSPAGILNWTSLVASQPPRLAASKPGQIDHRRLKYRASLPN